MSIIAFIPARGGSKSIPEKNIKIFCGRPLIFWNLQELQNSKVDKIVVATDSEKIKSVVNSFGFSKVSVFNRSNENSQDFSSTESVMLEYIKSVNLSDSDTFMLVQATSPFTQTTHFNEGLELFKQHNSILTCCESKRFSWRGGKALNYDIYNRPRRQDHKGTLIENGAFYISSVSDIKSTQNRISGDIGIYEMPEYTYTEIDEQEDWIVAESLMKRFVLNNKMQDFSKIKLFLSDVDGVLTDAGMYYTENGDEFKKFCTYDGMGFQLLQKTGVKVGILTTEDRELNRRRAKKLGLDFDFHGAKDKLQIVKDLCAAENITLDQVAYIGDDVNCFGLLSHVGIAACPNNAVDKIKAIPNIMHLERNGGDGVAREFVELFLS
ncbi:MAG: HAD hydrolase family protein [Flavobacteriales bacterium]|jgi:YrbI family 3-deoxy-D-manno-octulosonate 8-phosphate phosphatase|nr:HAD hydrolase family protein [Flavobacteriales bacterium]|tara:strand:+ start:242 stop:1381 length:1140 start_codon:yes stop_codon:yes gene_type:complete